MPKVKPHRTSPSLDMTPMVDLAFLLVTFFMLTTKFAPDEAVVIDTPASTSEIKLPEANVITISIDKDKRVFFNVDGEKVRAEALGRMAARYKVPLTEEQVKRFSVMTSFGLPVQQLPSFIDMDSEQRKEITQPGVPIDSLNNQLNVWVEEARRANQVVLDKPAFIAIKGDGDADVATVRKVISMLQDKNINRFNLITDLEGK